MWTGEHGWRGGSDDLHCDGRNAYEVTLSCKFPPETWDGRCDVCFLEVRSELRNAFPAGLVVEVLSLY